MSRSVPAEPSPGLHDPPNTPLENSPSDLRTRWVSLDEARRLALTRRAQARSQLEAYLHDHRN